MYGGGALLIREVVRRTGRGWPCILTLAFAYAIFEEAFTTQTLFNPNYLHLNLGLLKPAYIPALGIGMWWTVFVLTLHTVWSVSVSIGLVEALVPKRANQPWLGRPGLIVTAALFVLGAVISTRFALKSDPFLASRAQFTWSAIACLAVIVLAFRLPRTTTVQPSGNAAAPSPWVVGAAALVAGSIFLVTPREWAWRAVGIYLVLDVAMIAAVYLWSQRARWDGRHRLALAGGAALAYAWHAFLQAPVVPSSAVVNRISNAVFALALIVLLVIAARRNAAPA